MASHRCAFRVGVGLNGWVAAAGRSDRPRLVARAVDLSRTGIGLVCPGWPEVGAFVSVDVADVVDGHPIGRHWSGRVAYAREVSGGSVRVGVSFDWPVGPGARAETVVRGAARGARDAGGAGAAPGPGSWVVPALVAAGFAADQASKAWASTVGSGSDGWLDLWPGLLAVVPAENTGALGSLAGDSLLTAPLCAAAALGLAGLSFSGFRGSRGAAGSAGLGFLGAGLLGNSADRLALGHVRDFLVSGMLPGWSFNLADLFLVAGALAVIAARPASEPEPGPSGRREDAPGPPGFPWS